MDRSQLTAVVVLSEELHFGTAARRLGISQPALSQKLQKLEDDIGARLFIRSHRKVTMTDAGRVFLAQIHPVLSEIEGAVQLARKAAQGQIGSLHVGFVENASLNVLPSSVSVFRRQFPEVDLKLSEMISAELFNRLASGRIDIALTRPIAMDPDLETRLLVREPYLAVLPADHDLAGSDKVRISQLVQWPMIIAAGSKATYLRMQFAPVYARVGYGLNIGQEVNQLPAILGLVSSGIGYALLPQSVAQLRTAGVVYRELAIKNAPQAELIAVWHPRNDNPAVKRYLECLSTAGASAGG